jgi:3-oxoacyl-[acyl-carrier protein] reductase
MVLALSAAGASVAVHHLGQAEQAEALADAVREEGRRAVVVEGDVTDWEAVESMVAAVEDSLGLIDILVNNAGLMEEVPFVETTRESWDRTLAVDLTGVFTCTRHVIPGMLSRGRGSIVNVASQLAFKGASGLAAYCAAKAGVIGLTRALAREVGPEVRVNAVAPGPVETPMIAPYASPEWRTQRTKDLVIGRVATPEEVAPAVVFLSSDESALFQGQTLHPNGGGVML